MKNQIKVQKKDGTITELEPKKIEESIKKALLSTGNKTSISKIITQQTINEIEKHFSDYIIPKTEDIQDIIEELLIKNKLKEAEKAYGCHREKNKIQFRTFLGIHSGCKANQCDGAAI